MAVPQARAVPELRGYAVEPFVEQDSGVCGVVYIAAESDGDAWHPKRSQPGNAPEPTQPSKAVKRKSTCLCCITIVVVAALVVIAGGVGGIVLVSILQRRHHQQQQLSHAKPSLAPTNASAAVATTVPLTIHAILSATKASSGFTCDCTFGDPEAVRQLKTNVQAAYSKQLGQVSFTSISVTKVQCNGFSYYQQSAGDSQQMRAAKALLRKLQPATPGSASPQAMSELVMDLSIDRNQYVNDIDLEGEISWVQQVRGAATDVSHAVVPNLLTAILGKDISCKLDIVQLPAVITSSTRRAPSHASSDDRTSNKPADLQVNRTVVEPYTGIVLGIQTITIPSLSGPVQGTTDAASAPAAPSHNAAAANGSDSSKNSSGGTKQTDAAAPAAVQIPALSAETPTEPSDTQPPAAANESPSPPTTVEQPLEAEMPADQPPVTEPTAPSEPTMTRPSPSPSPASAEAPSTKVPDCGGVCQLANANAMCLQGRCVVETCWPGWEDCDRLISNGCEADVLQFFTDSYHCGSCAKMCLAPLVCMAGNCSMSSSSNSSAPGALPILYSDTVRMSPADTSITIDALANDDLAGFDPQQLKIIIIFGPSCGTVTLTPAPALTITQAAANTAGSSEGINASQGKLQVMYTPKAPLSAGQEVEIYYTVEGAGVQTPAPANILVVGAAAPSNPDLISCSPPAEVITATPLSSLNRADDAPETITLPFTFSLYGTNYTTATVSSNGWISLGASGAAEPCSMSTQWPIAPCLGTGPVLAVFWDDLQPDTVLTHHDTILDALLIQWSNVMFTTNQSPLGTIQAYLFSNGSIGYVYRDLLGTDKALGGTAAVGIKGPVTADDAFDTALASQTLASTGLTADSHATWLYALSVDDPSSVITLGTQQRFLNPGLALISHSGPTGIPSPFQIWQMGSAGVAHNSTAQLLVAPGVPYNPILAQASGNLVSAESGQLIVTFTWRMPEASPAVQGFRLYVAADPLFDYIIRQPSSDLGAWDPDIPSNARNADVVVDKRLAEDGLYVELLACNELGCSRPCRSQMLVTSSSSSTSSESIVKPSL